MSRWYDIVREMIPTLHLLDHLRLYRRRAREAEGRQQDIASGRISGPGASGRWWTLDVPGHPEWMCPAAVMTYQERVQAFFRHMASGTNDIVGNEHSVRELLKLIVFHGQTTLPNVDAEMEHFLEDGYYPFQCEQHRPRHDQQSVMAHDLSHRHLVLEPARRVFLGQVAPPVFSPQVSIPSRAVATAFNLSAGYDPASDLADALEVTRLV